MYDKAMKRKISRMDQILGRTEAKRMLEDSRSYQLVRIGIYLLFVAVLAERNELVQEIVAIFLATA